jgi:PTS system nitrogen regulatory IIA component
MVDANPISTIKSLLASESIAFDVRANDKFALLRDLSQRAASVIDVPAGAIFHALSKREELGSTGIGAGVAIPHARLAEITKPFALAARLKPAVNFNSIDGRHVDLVFLLLVPLSSDKDHLNVLAAISRLLRDRGVVERLRGSTDAGAFYNALTT